MVCFMRVIRKSSANAIARDLRAATSSGAGTHPRAGGVSRETTPAAPTHRNWRIRRGYSVSSVQRGYRVRGTALTREQCSPATKARVITRLGLHSLRARRVCRLHMHRQAQNSTCRASPLADSLRPSGGGNEYEYSVRSNGLVGRCIGSALKHGERRRRPHLSAVLAGTGLAYRPLDERAFTHSHS